MSRRILHVLSQRPLLTGSGVTLDALVRHGNEAGWQQAAIVGTPEDAPRPDVGGLGPGRVHPLIFGRPPLSMAVPGMSDVMPYPSTRFSTLEGDRLEAYLEAWRSLLSDVVGRFQPDLVHSHHVWLLSGIIKDVCPQLPQVIHCHGTGFRQMDLCAHLARPVVQGCRRAERFLALHGLHGDRLLETLAVPRDRVRVVGAGYRDEVFHGRSRATAKGCRLAYAGKFSRAKGLPWLLDAVERLAERFPSLVLHVAGSGSGGEAEALRGRMEAMAPRVVLHGHLGQEALAALLRTCSVFVLPSFYEGLPLVLVEALACGCRLVCTRLEGVARELASPLGEVLELVDLPRLQGPDEPWQEDLPRFVDDLADTLGRVLAMPPLDDPASTMPGLAEPFTWAAVFRRVSAVWEELLV